MEINYKQLLKKGREKLPESVKNVERFELPKAKGHVEGNKTIINNFTQIANDFHRDQFHLLKFLQRELATPAIIKGPRLILGRKIPAQLINSKIELYANTFVLCPDCKKPDTKMKKEHNVVFLKCMACGAKHPIKAKI